MTQHQWTENATAFSDRGSYAVMDYGRQYIKPNLKANQWTLPFWNEFKEILKRLDELDTKLDQHECHDPAKAELDARD